jgi:hypothetical protein
VLTRPAGNVSPPVPLEERSHEAHRWLDRKGLPHTERLRTVERFTRADRDTMRYEITVDDPGAYTMPWTTSVIFRWEPNTELFEYVCQQANYAIGLMVGDQEFVDRSSLIVP